ncbi:MAG: InlB B-repeat-containing protein [Oscillospiraceae bacterium]|nr:InlB B-repeat-containing protein [Oscillospiraceae bacterium]
MKKILCAVLAVCLICSGLSVTALAVDESRTYDFDLTINGSHEVQALPGEILTVTLTMRRTDRSEEADMYALQDEIRYDDEFFEVVEGSALVSNGIETTDISLMGGDRSFYMNFLSLTGGESWKPEVVIGSFQVKVLSNSGSSELKNENCRVSVKDGSDSYATSVQDVKVVVSTDCTVRFEPMDGVSEAWEVKAPMGSLLEEPEAPGRQGYIFDGWCRDTQGTQPWDFETDTVQGNMTLYAKWLYAKAAGSNGEMAEIVATGSALPWWAIAIMALAVLALAWLIILLLLRKKVEFDSDGGTSVKTVRVFKGRTIDFPLTVKPGYEFAGWFTDTQHLTAWDFENDKVSRSMTLYAKWI